MNDDYRKRSLANELTYVNFPLNEFKMTIKKLEEKKNG